jgi:hypothetical protein
LGWTNPTLCARRIPNTASPRLNAHNAVPPRPRRQPPTSAPVAHSGLASSRIRRAERSRVRGTEERDDPQLLSGEHVSRELNRQARPGQSGGDVVGFVSLRLLYLIFASGRASGLSRPVDPFPDMSSAWASIPTFCDGAAVSDSTPSTSQPAAVAQQRRRWARDAVLILGSSACSTGVSPVPSGSRGSSQSSSRV